MSVIKPKAPQPCPPPQAAQCDIPQTRHRKVRPTQQFYSASSRDAKKTIRNGYPDQGRREVPEEVMAGGRGGRYSSPPGGHRSSYPTPQQNRLRQPYVQPTQQFYEHRTDTPRPGPVWRNTHFPEQHVYPPSAPMIKPIPQQHASSWNGKKTIVSWSSKIHNRDPEHPFFTPSKPDLLKTVSSVLSRQTLHKFLHVLDEVEDFPIDTEEQLKGLLDVIYENAMKETSLLAYYGAMCSSLAPLKVPTTDNPQITVSFRKLLVIRCHEEFRRKPKELDSRGRYIGNIKFIGELFKVKFINDVIMQDCLDNLLKNYDELALECLCILLTNIVKELEFDEPQLDHYFNFMEKIVTEGKTSPRIRGLLQDTIDLVSHNLESRKAEQGPEPVKQIAKEAVVEEQEEPRNVQKQLLSKELEKQPDDAAKLQPAAQRSSSPGLVQPVERQEAQPTPPATEPELPLPASLSPPIKESGSSDLSSSSEVSPSEDIWYPEELRKQMMTLLLEDMASDEDMFNCVKEKLKTTQVSSPPYLRELMRAVCKAAAKGNTNCRVHTALLQKGVPEVLVTCNSEEEQQTKALQELQVLIVALDRPPDLLRIFFRCMKDKKARSEEADQLGKGVGLEIVTAFFTWLREAEGS